jgi:hypothetical protein
VDFAGVPATWINDGEWFNEFDRWLLPYSELSALITEPTGVLSLLSELAQSCMLYIWVDEREQLIKLRAVRAPEEAVSPLTDEAHILAGSPSRAIRMEEQVSLAIVYYGVVDPTQRVDEVANYQFVRGRPGRQLGEPRIRRIFSRWLKTERQASQTARTLLRAANALPVFVSCRVGAKDLDLWTGRVVELDDRLVQDVTGLPEKQLFQVIEANETRGREMALTLRTFGAFPPVSVYMAADADDYTETSEEDRKRAGFWAAADGTLDGSPSPYMWS